MARLTTLANYRRRLLRAIAGGAACLLALTSTGCSLTDDRNPDSRAYEDSASDITLEEALGDNGVKLPSGATNVRFAVYIGRDDAFDLTFDLTCGAISGFLASSSIKSPLKSAVLLPSLVETAGREHDWEVGSYDNPRSIEDDRLGAVLRSIVVVSASEQSCKVFLSAIR